MRAATVLSMIVLASCASHPAAAPEPAAPSASAGASEPAPTGTEAAPAAASAPAASATPPPPPPTGGAVLVGDIVAPKTFNPKPAVEAMKPQMLGCYNKARASNPSLRGKLTLHIQVNEAGNVLSVDADPDGKAYDPTLVSCINDAMKASAHFPKPGGMATVNAPLVFHP